MKVSAFQLGFDFSFTGSRVMLFSVLRRKTILIMHQCFQLLLRNAVLSQGHFSFSAPCTVLSVRVAEGHRALGGGQNQGS